MCDDIHLMLTMLIVALFGLMQVRFQYLGYGIPF